MHSEVALAEAQKEAQQQEHTTSAHLEGEVVGAARRRRVDLRWQPIRVSVEGRQCWHPRYLWLADVWAEVAGSRKCEL